ncbi:uncharacterized protein LOC143549044 [Bidens hawaiensis]|uniref:uncharacterized protein LOC143549044 n=1 Tax=Bidens hawaiensis TaxID=980011 RepID=UPI004049A28A
MSKYTQWYYVSCKVCTKAVKDRVNNDGGVEGVMSLFQAKYFCKGKCNNAIVEAVPRYRINLSVQDTTGVVELSLWEGHANRLLKISAYDMLVKLINGPPDSSLFPEELKKLENKVFAFKIAVNQYNLDNEGVAYNVAKLTDDAFILSELQKKINSNQSQESDSITVGAAVETFSVKDVISVTDDNLNAIEKSTGKSMATNKENTSLTCSSPILKRNLIDVYDVDHPPTQSTIKSYSGTTFVD